MKKAFLLGTVILLVFGLIYAWAGQPTITKTHVMTDISVDQQVIKEVTPNVNSYSRELGSNEVPFTVDRKDSKKEVAEEVEISQEMSRLEVHQANLIALKAAGEPTPIVIMEDSCSGDSIQIEILSDTYPSETSWELWDQIGPTLVASGAPSAASTVEIWQVCVEVDQCYDFYVYDAYGDGIYSPGYCDVSLNGSLVYHFAGSFTTLTGELGGGCAAPEGACCVAEVCVATNTEAECDGLGGSWHIGETCPEYWCEDDWNCTDNPPTDKDPGGDIDTPSEPANDSLSGAAPAFVEHAYCGTLDNGGGDADDYYSVTLPAGPDPFYCLHVRIFADDTPHQYAFGGGLDPRIYIYADDSLNTQLFYQDDENGEFPNSVHYDSQFDCDDIENCFAAGTTLYIRAAAYGTGPYLLIINAYACEGDPLGRCCYGDPYAPTCTDETEGDCDALTGTWDFGLNCVDDPCVALPANDECADAQVITEVTDYTFTTVGATTDGINNYANQNVWFCYTP
ncbi:MAG: hypothetical protein GY839_10445, partial [candidate division Zixibacteria bacterium]|nr:hypothetical protein [candidate division Zixibacteria bacterium]